MLDNLPDFEYLPPQVMSFSCTWCVARSTVLLKTFPILVVWQKFRPLSTNIIFAVYQFSSTMDLDAAPYHYVSATKFHRLGGLLLIVSFSSWSSNIFPPIRMQHYFPFISKLRFDTFRHSVLCSVLKTSIIFSIVSCLRVFFFLLPFM